MKSRTIGAVPSGQTPAARMPSAQKLPVTLATASKNSKIEKWKRASTRIDSRIVPAHQQHRLDDLDPGRRQHAAEDHVDEHQRADRDDRGVEADGRARSRLTSEPAPTICAIM